jgi:hypothetical protein
MDHKELPDRIALAVQIRQQADTASKPGLDTAEDNIHCPYRASDRESSIDQLTELSYILLLIPALNQAMKTWSGVEWRYSSNIIDLGTTWW